MIKKTNNTKKIPGTAIPGIFILLTYFLRNLCNIATAIIYYILNFVKYYKKFFGRSYNYHQKRLLWREAECRQCCLYPNISACNHLY